MQQEFLSLSLPLSLSKLTAVLFFVALSILSFFVPFSFGHPQWIVGTIVNACLFFAAAFLPKKFLLPIVVFPSLGVLARGVIFGPFTVFLLYFLPFIWLGNFTLILVFKKIFPKFRHFSIFFAAVAKFLFLFLIASTYFKLSLVPKLFLQTMGIFQLFTAIAGGLIFLLVFYGKYNSRNKRTF